MAPAGIDGDFGYEVRPDIRRVVGRGIEVSAAGVGVRRRHQRRVRPVEDGRLRAFGCQAGGDDAKILDYPGLRVAQPRKPWNVLRVDGQWDILLPGL
jgi:hypothetical protein